MQGVTTLALDNGSLTRRRDIPSGTDTEDREDSEDSEDTEDRGIQRTQRMQILRHP